jgi:hypothetical protein
MLTTFVWCIWGTGKKGGDAKKPQKDLNDNVLWGSEHAMLKFLINENVSAAC